MGMAIDGVILCQEIGPGNKQYVIVMCHSDLHADAPQDIISEDELTHGAMFVPIVLGSDKTTVSIATGQSEFHPLYIFY